MRHMVYTAQDRKAREELGYVPIMTRNMGLAELVEDRTYALTGTQSCVLAVSGLARFSTIYSQITSLNKLLVLSQSLGLSIS